MRIARVCGIMLILNWTKKNKNRQINDIFHDDEVLTQDLEKANYFNKFFSSAASKLKDSVTGPIEPQEIL